MKSIYSRIVLNTVSQLGSRAVAIVTGLVSVSLITRYLGPSQYGIFSLIFTYLSFFGELSDAGLNLKVVKDLSAPGKRKIDVYVTTKALLIAASILLALIVLLFLPYDYTTKVGILVASVAVSIGYFTSFGTALLQAKLKMERVAVVDVLNKLVSLLFVWIFISMQLSIFYIIGSVIVSNIASFALMAYFVSREYEIGFTVDFGKTLRLIRSAVPIGVTTLISLFQFKIDTFFLSLMRSSADVGIYSLSYKLFENAIIFWGLYMASIYPLLSRYHEEHNKKKFDEFFTSSVNVLLLMSVAIIIAGYVFGAAFIGILGGEEYVQSVLPFRILLLALPFLFMNNLFYHGFLAEGRNRTNVLIMSIGLLVNVIANLLIIPVHGYNGAAATTVFTTGLVCTLYLYTRYFRKSV